eukprot:SAG11_NODE_4351_length_1936_cov_23.129559_1_plen_227_part_00
MATGETHCISFAFSFPKGFFLFSLLASNFTSKDSHTHRATATTARSFQGRSMCLGLFINVASMRQAVVSNCCRVYGESHPSTVDSSSSCQLIIIIIISHASVSHLILSHLCLHSLFQSLSSQVCEVVREGGPSGRCRATSEENIGPTASLSGKSQHAAVLDMKGTEETPSHLSSCDQADTPRASAMAFGEWDAVHNVGRWAKLNSLSASAVPKLAREMDEMSAIES